MRLRGWENVVRTIFGFILMLAATLGIAEEGAVLRAIPVEGLPEGDIASYAILDSQTGRHLVVESRAADGTVGFYVLDYVDRTMRARATGASGLPGRFREPPTGGPEARVILGRGEDVETGRFWPVGSTHSPMSNKQFVEAVSLQELRYVDVSAAVSAELPPAGAGLEIGYIVTDVDGAVQRRCRLEPNLVRPGERLTPTSAMWILAQGEPHLLVGMASDRGNEPWPVFYRLYSSAMELVYQSPVAHHANPNAFPQPVMADVTGDGEPEVVVLAGLGGVDSDYGGLAVLQPGPSDPATRRVLALNGCAVRMNGPDVAALQRALERRGYSVGPHGIDGWYGPDTRAAVVALQRATGTLVTGVVDETTWRQLDLW